MSKDSELIIIGQARTEGVKEKRSSKCLNTQEGEVSQKIPRPETPMSCWSFLGLIYDHSRGGFIQQTMT